MTTRGHLLIRKIPFEFDEGIDPIWHKDQPEWSHMINGVSLTMPYLEPFLIRSVREAIVDISDEDLKEEVRLFNAQEGQHYQNHRRYNEILKANGYEELAEVEKAMETDYARLQSKPLKWRLAYALGFETLTLGITDWNIGQRQKLFAGADTSIVSLFLWHIVEETEHKNVAFDLYNHFYKDYWARVWGIVCATTHVVWWARKGYIAMLKKDGRWAKTSSRWTTFKRSMNALWSVGKVLAPTFLPGFDPGQIKDPKWVADWAEAYENLAEDEIPLLNTDHPDIPAQFA